MHTPILYVTFHGIGAPPPSTPDDETPYWIDTEDFTGKLNGLVEDARRAGVDLVATFDDGNRSDIETAAPLLETLGIPGMFFPCAGRIGQAGYLDVADLRNLRDAGFTVGSHGMDHVPWAKLKGADLQRETAEAKIIIEDALGEQVATAALPFGSYNRRTLAALQSTGFARVFSSDPGLSRPDAWFVRRFSYRAGQYFDLATMYAVHSPFLNRAFNALKHRIKALR